MSRCFSLFFGLYERTRFSPEGKGASPRQIPGAFVSSTRTAGSNRLANVNRQKYYRCSYFGGRAGYGAGIPSGHGGPACFCARGTQVPQESQILHPASSSEWFSGTPLAVSFLVTPCFWLNIQFVSSIRNGRRNAGDTRIKKRTEETDIGGAADPIAECYYVLKL